MSSRRQTYVDLSVGLEAGPGASAPMPTIEHPTVVPVSQVAPNPIVHRQAHEDLSDLEGMKTRQLQPCVVVTKTAFLRIFPEYDDHLQGLDRQRSTGESPIRYVVVDGTRRRLAAAEWGLELRIGVNDSLAVDRATLLAALWEANDARKGFDVIEDAEVVARIVSECVGNGGYDRVMQLLPAMKSKAIISQRMALTKLTPELKDLVRAGVMPVNQAREIGGLPAGEQARAWEDRQAQAEAARAAKAAARAAGRRPRRPRDAVSSVPDAAPTEVGSRAAFTVEAGLDVAALARLLREHLDDDELRSLTRELISAYGA